MKTNFADCRCGGKIFERSVAQDRWEWAHVDAFDSHDLNRCPDGLSALPVVGTQTNPRSRVNA